MRVGLAADHQGFALKEQLFALLRDAKEEVVDFGARTLTAEDDFPDFVFPLALAVERKEMERGIAICGSGIGASIAANKVRSVRAGLIHDLFSARQGVEDDDMNFICIGARLVSPAFAFELVQCFLAARFSNEPRYVRRLNKISKFEEGAR